jgi:hypothetical protein
LGRKTVNIPNYGAYLIVQGSEDNFDKKPYVKNLKTYIEENGLGTVMIAPPAPNVLHGGKPTYYGIWVLDKDGIRKWGNKVIEAEKAEEKAKEDARKLREQQKLEAAKQLQAAQKAEELSLKKEKVAKIKPIVKKRVATRKPAVVGKGYLQFGYERGDW